MVGAGKWAAPPHTWSFDLRLFAMHPIMASFILSFFL
jgi:hypothetical protein